MLGVLGGVQESFNRSARNNKRISVADVIVLGGAAAIDAGGNESFHDEVRPENP